MSVGESNECSVNYDPISGRTRRPPQPVSPSMTRTGSGGHRSTGGSTSHPSRRDGTGKVGNDGTSALESVTYNTIADGAGHNVDADGITAIGQEIKERFHDMRTAFLKMDVNRDGRISKREILEMCHKWNIPRNEAQRVLSAADLDGNGTLDFQEFCDRFNPYEGPEEEEQLSFTQTQVDDRPIKASGWGGEEMTAKPASPIAGSGAAAARALASCPRCAELEARNAELEARVRALEAELANLRSAQGAADRAAADARARADSDRASADADRARAEAEAAAARARADADAASARARAEAEAREREDAARRAREAEEAAADEGKVILYGRKGDKKTEALMKALRGVQVPFEFRDYDSDTRWRGALERAGCPNAVPPFVCYAGKVWWDDPANASGADDSCGMPWHAVAAMEIRREWQSRQTQVDDTPVRMDATIDEEIEERFHTMQQAFLEIDDNKDGVISKRELLAKCKNWNIPASEATRILGEADRDMDQQLDFNEFCRRFSTAYNIRPGTTLRPNMGSRTMGRTRR